MGPGELSPSGGNMTPRAGSANIKSAGLFSPSLVSVYSALAVRLSEAGVAVCHLTWRSPPIRPGASNEMLKKAKTLKEVTAELEAAVKFLRATHEADTLSPSLPLVLVGFCLGGAACLSAAANTLRSFEPDFQHAGLGPLAGIVGIGLAPRVEERTRPNRSYGGGDTHSAMQALAQRAVPLLLLHGTSDEVVDLPAVALLFETYLGVKAAGWLLGAEHDLASRFDAALETTHAWVLGLLRRYVVTSGMLTQFAPPAEANEGIPFGYSVSF